MALLHHMCTWIAGEDDLVSAPGYRQAVLLEEVSELSRTRCTRLKAIHDEYYVIALIDAFIRQKQVSGEPYTCRLLSHAYFSAG